MRGNPRLEWVMVLLLGLLLAWPLARLTRGGGVGRTYAHAEPLVARDTETWFDLRFSHPPESFVLSQGETVLASGGGSHREEAESALRVTDGREVPEVPRRHRPEEHLAARGAHALEGGLDVLHLHVGRPV